MDLVLLSCPFMSNEDRLQREKIPAEFLPFPLTAWLGLYMALKLHALMDRGRGGKQEEWMKGGNPGAAEEICYFHCFLSLSLSFFLFFFLFSRITFGV